MSSPAARVAVDALGMTPRNYGHLIQMAARYAWQRLDGHAVVNRQTGAPVILDWERGMKNATAPGTPPALLLAVPAIPAMLAAARYVGALAPRPPYPPHVLRYHAFEATAEIGGGRIDAILIVQEDRQHRLFLDRLLGGEALPQRNAGGANSDAPNSAMPPAGNAPSPHAAAASLADEPRGASTLSSPVAARVAVDTLGMPPRSYGHLIQMAARYAWQRLDGHAVVNRQTGAPIMLDWERGLKNATAPGMPPALLLTVPAIPAMLAAARYLGALAPRPPYPPHVLRYHAFSATAEAAGRRLDVILITHEDRQHRLFLDRVLGRNAPPRRRAGGAIPDASGSMMVPADDAAGADWPLAGWSGPSADAWSSGSGGIGRLMPDQSDAPGNFLDDDLVNRLDGLSGREAPLNDLVNRFTTRPAPEDAKKFMTPVSTATPPASGNPGGNDPWGAASVAPIQSRPATPASPAGYVGTRGLGGVLEGGKWLGVAASSEMGQYDQAQEMANLPSGQETANKWIYGQPDVDAPGPVSRYAGAVATAAGANPVLAAIAPGYAAAGALGSEAGADVNAATGSHLPDWLARFIGGAFGGGLYGAGKAGVNAAVRAATAAPKSSPLGDLPSNPTGASQGAADQAAREAPLIKPETSAELAGDKPSPPLPPSAKLRPDFAVPASAQDLRRAISALPEEEQEVILGRVVRGDKKGRPFGSDAVPRFPTVEEFNPRIEQVRAGDLEKVVTTKHVTNERQAGPVSQLSNEGLVRFRLKEPISATRGENGLSLTGGHHRTAEVISRVNAGMLDPNTMVPFLIHD